MSLYILIEFLSLLYLALGRFHQLLLPFYFSYLFLWRQIDPPYSLFSQLCSYVYYVWQLSPAGIFRNENGVSPSSGYMSVFYMSIKATETLNINQGVVQYRTIQTSNIYTQCNIMWPLMQYKNTNYAYLIGLNNLWIQQYISTYIINMNVCFCHFGLFLRKVDNPPWQCL